MVHINFQRLVCLTDLSKIGSTQLIRKSSSKFLLDPLEEIAKQETLRENVHILVHVTWLLRKWGDTKEKEQFNRRVSRTLLNLKRKIEFRSVQSLDKDLS